MKPFVSVTIFNAQVGTERGVFKWINALPDNADRDETETAFQALKSIHGAIHDWHDCNTDSVRLDKGGETVSDRELFNDYIVAEWWRQ